jgi:23S rRNA (guanosine2251-2'-O)-methyltransferase
MILGRLNPITEAVRTRPRQVEWVLFDSSRKDRRINELKALCRRQGVSLRYAEGSALDRMAGANQGAVARLAVRAYGLEDEATSGEKGKRFLFLLDEIQDPQNLGALIRVAEGVGARVVVPERGSAPLSEAVERSSAGSVERVPIFRVGNLRRFIDLLKDEGFRVVGLDPSGTDVYRVDLTGDLALVFGAEARGMRRLVRQGCDILARLPMRGELASLNVSTAAAAAGYEALRQRSHCEGNP